MNLIRRLPSSWKLSAARQLARTGPLLARVFKDRIPVVFEGFVIDTASPLVDDATRVGLFLHTYESSERRAIERFLAPRRPVIELGASIGFISLLIARKAHPSTQIAVEANPDLIPVLRRNLESNGASGVIVLHAAVAYDGANEVPFQVSNDNLGGRLAVGAGSDRVLRRVPSVTLQQILDQNQIDAFTLVADIEGAEWDLMEHESEATSRRCRQAIFELHEIEREGRRIARAEMAAHFMARWRMRLVHSDQKVWVFER